MNREENIFTRALGPDDLAVFKAMRLRALKEHPGVYMFSYEEALKQDESIWLETLDGQGKQVFGLFDGDALIGITAIFTWRKDPSGKTAVLAMSFIDPSYRGRGLSGLLYEARLNWAVGYKPFETLVVSHRAGNAPSRAAILRHGFQFKGTERIIWPDGAEEDELIYRLDLIALRNRNLTNIQVMLNVLPSKEEKYEQST